MRHDTIWAAILVCLEGSTIFEARRAVVLRIEYVFKLIVISAEAHNSRGFTLFCQYW